jgi:hypothetical protein
MEMHLSLRFPPSPKNRSIIKISENNMERVPYLPQLSPMHTLSEPSFFEPLKALLTRLTEERGAVQEPCSGLEHAEKELLVLKQRTCELEYEVKNLSCDLGELIVLFKEGVLA